LNESLRRRAAAPSAAELPDQVLELRLALDQDGGGLVFVDQREVAAVEQKFPHRRCGRAKDHIDPILVEQPVPAIAAALDVKMFAEQAVAIEIGAPVDENKLPALEAMDEITAEMQAIERAPVDPALE
jgi:hypothetical protein